MAHLQTTLETAGYLYDPFSQSSVFGNPHPFINAETSLNQMPKTHDDSALPQFNDPAYQAPEYKQGSNIGEPWHNNRDKRTQMVITNTTYLIALGAVLAFALLYKP